MGEKEKAEKGLNYDVENETNCKNKLFLARRFIGALVSSSEFGTLNIQECINQLDVIIGDILIPSVFALYWVHSLKNVEKELKHHSLNYTK